MAIDTDILAADLDLLVADLPVTVTFGGTDYTGTMGEIGQETEMMESGYMPQADVELIVAQSEFALVTAPAVNDKITIDSVSYRITRKDIDQSAAGFRFLLKKVK